ncbi:MAG: trypsin-like peptidase domain-containing protein [Bacteroidota bacterium]
MKAYALVPMMRLLAALFVVLIAPSSFAYSVEYCTSVTEAITNAFQSKDWERLLNASKEKEKNCGRFVPLTEIAETLGDQAFALWALNRPKESLNTADRCLRMTPRPECHFIRGQALDSLGRNDEAKDAFREARRLAELGRRRLRQEILRASLPHERSALEAERKVYQTIINSANRALENAPPPAHSALPQPRLSAGSGVVISIRGLILTNNHVIAGCEFISVSDIATRKTPASVQFNNADADLAVLSTSLSFPAAAVFRESPEVEVGEPVTAVGYPFTGILASSAKVSFGHISALAGIADDPSRMQISAPIHPGSSGGPLLDQSGNLLGIVTEKLDAIRTARATGDIPQNVGFAIKGTVVREVLNRGGVNTTVQPSGRRLESTGIARSGAAITVLVECQRNSLPQD